jgi:predicted RNase H-like HicB family nuclease
VSAIQVIYRQEDGVWGAESPDVVAFGAAADTLDELRALVREGLAFYLEDDNVELDERFPYPVALSTQPHDSPFWTASVTTSGSANVHSKVTEPVAIVEQKTSQ